jgi:hypothetical protein
MMMSYKPLHMRLALLLSASLAVSACADRFSTQEAYDTCEDIADRTDTFTEESFADCVDCHERCGADCEQQNAEPPDEYVCPEDIGE